MMIRFVAGPTARRVFRRDLTQAKGPHNTTGWRLCAVTLVGGNGVPVARLAEQVSDPSRRRPLLPGGA